MTLFALEPAVSDFYAVWGFVVGVVGLVVGLVGFGVTIRQVQQTKRAAEAAREAATRTLSESKRSYSRFVGAYAWRLLSELQRAANDREWAHAVVRSNDLADLLGSLPDAPGATTGLVASLRDASQKFAVRASGTDPRFSRPKWNRLLSDLHALLDTLRAPFGDDRHGEFRPHDPRQEVQDDRSGPPGQDQGRAGELGEGGRPG